MIKDELKAAGLSKADLARGLGISPAAVSQWDVLPPKAVDWIRDHLSEREGRLRHSIEPTLTGLKLKTECDLTNEELLALALRRGKEPDWKIALSIGVKPHVLQWAWDSIGAAKDNWKPLKIDKDVQKWADLTKQHFENGLNITQISKELEKGAYFLRHRYESVYGRETGL